MNVFLRIRSLGSSRSLRALPIALMFLLPAFLPAQNVPVTTSGSLSVAGIPPVYNGQYVLQTTDFGFLWLDTVALQGGLVQVESKCGIGLPNSNTGTYVIGDCNGIGDVATLGNLVVARQFNGQCGAATVMCGGDRVDGTGLFAFRLGTWEYLGRTDTDIANSTQRADPLGRTWKVQTVNLRNFTWNVVSTGVGTPTPTPTANLTPTPTPTPGIGGSLWTVAPCRVLDTRNPNGPLGGPALSAGAVRTFVIAGRCGVPSSARAVSVNVTVTQPTAGGSLLAYPAGLAEPLATTINYRAGQTRANNAVVGLNTSGAAAVRCRQGLGTVHMIIDVNGYFQ